MNKKADSTFEELPPVYLKNLLSLIQKKFVESGKILVVLDDDPTGTQTSYDVPVLMRWDIPFLKDELQKKPPILFILTNSRSLSEKDAVNLTLEVGRNLSIAAKICHQELVVVSRSDSTLRGHFPGEVQAIMEAFEKEAAVWILLPAFLEGKRYTIGNVHYLKVNQELIPVSQTPFAKDQAFGYQNSNLKDWVEEKTKGKVKAENVHAISLEDIRIGGPEVIRDKLLECAPGEICIVNACDISDIEVFVFGSMMAEKMGMDFIFRTSATFVPTRAGMTSGKKATIKRSEYPTVNGSLIISGSYVPLTTEQLKYLMEKKEHFFIEIDVKKILKGIDPNEYLKKVIAEIDQHLIRGNDVAVFTSRELQKGTDPENSLMIHGIISNFLVNIVKGISARPSFMIAKGGITSSELASKGLKADKALILGQVLPGVPVWELEENSKFPGLNYVVFPGNVGERDSLYEVYTILKST